MSATLLANSGIVPISEFNPKGDGKSDDAAILQKAIHHAESIDGTLVLEPVTYRCDSELKIDHSRITILGNGATLDFSKMPKGTAITIAGHISQYEDTFRATKHYIERLDIRGQKKLTCFQIGTDAKNDYAVNLSIRNVRVQSFDLAATWRNNAWDTDFTNCSFYECHTIVHIPSKVKTTGERIVFDKCVFANYINVADLWTGTIFFNNCSLDYFKEYAISASNGASAYLNGCHCEAKADGDYWFKTNDPYSSIFLTQCRFDIAGNRTKEIGHGFNKETVAGIFVSQSTITPRKFKYEPESFFTGTVHISDVAPRKDSHRWSADHR